MEGNWLIKKYVKTVFFVQQVENDYNNEVLVGTTFFFLWKTKISDLLIIIFVIEINYAKLYFQREIKYKTSILPISLTLIAQSQN